MSVFELGHNEEDQSMDCIIIQRCDGLIHHVILER